jgi:acetylornithine/N-succinyldiaminopimelate aminotransferase
MKLFDVYPLMNIVPKKAKGSYTWDEHDNKYLDLYGGHAVISVGHSHEYYVSQLKKQLDQIGFYSNSVINPLQEELAYKLGELSGYEDYSLFLCNSGAEANENALKLASFHNHRNTVIVFSKSFHGRTSLAVAATDDASIRANINTSHTIIFLPLNDEAAFLSAISSDICAVLIEGIQGVGGIREPDASFMQLIYEQCKKHNVCFIVDEVQSGYGRTGKFFAHQYAGVKPDIITVAKGMGNGFPVAGVLISPQFKSRHGLLGTTFGGNYLACAASISVLDIIKNENLIENAKQKGAEWIKTLSKIEGVKHVRGKGLMIGIEFEVEAPVVKQCLFTDHRILIGTSSDKKTLRLLPALNIGHEEINYFNSSLNDVLQQHLKTV